jgi:predicted secreted protein
MAGKTLDFSDNTLANSAGEAILAVGDQLVVKVFENTSAGYIWDLDRLPDGLVDSQPDYEPADTDPEVCGGGGVSVFSFRVEGQVTPDADELRLCYHRMWEAKTAAIRTATVKVRTVH